MAERLRLGELLVEMRLISREQLERALALQATDSRRLGEILVRLGMVSESQLTQVLSQQLSVPWVALQHIDFSRQLLNLVPSDVAEKYGIVPIYVRRARNRQETLYVAMEDPSDEEPLRAIAEYTSLPVRAMIAPPTDIRAAIRAYYLGLPPEEEQTEIELVHPSQRPEPSAAHSPPPPPSIRPASPPRAARSIPAPPPPMSSAIAPSRAASPRAAEDAEAPHYSTPPDSTPPDSSTPDSSAPESGSPESGPLEARDAKMPLPSQAAKAPRMVKITMLDGTEINLPAADTLRRRGHESRAPSADLTARDLIEALRAQAAGADAREVLGEGVSWESMFTALLSVLLKKHLIHDWEFVRELRRG